MLRHVQFSALAVGVFVGYALPLVIDTVLALEMIGAVEQQEVDAARRMFAIMVVVNLGGSVVGGYVTARLARHQPLLHGLLTAVAGLLLVSPFRGVSALWLFAFLVSGITGAWLSSHR